MIKAEIRDRGSILGASAGAEVLNIFAFAPERCGRLVAMVSQLTVDGFDVGLGPADAGNFDLAVGSDIENRRHVGQAVSVRHRIVRWIVKRSEERRVGKEGRSR